MRETSINGVIMLEKLAKIANELDIRGYHREADGVTEVMKRVSGFFSREQRPIQDFNGLDGLDGFGGMGGLGDLFGDDQSREDPLNMVRIHAVLRNKGVDPNGITDEQATQIYQAIMGSEAMSAGNMSMMASSTPRIKKTA